MMMQQVAAAAAQQDAAAAPPPQSLSAAQLAVLGWQQVQDPVTYRMYWHHAASGIASWLPPTAQATPPPAPAPPPPPPPPAEPPPLPAGWDHWMDPATGRPVFRNLYTGATQWEDPRNGNG